MGKMELISEIGEKTGGDVEMGTIKFEEVTAFSCKSFTVGQIKFVLLILVLIGIFLVKMYM